MAETGTFEILQEDLVVRQLPAKPFGHLRLRRPDPEALAALGAAFGLAWPVQPNTSSAAPGVSVLWLAPGEWALVGMAIDEARRRAAMALGERLHHLADVSDGRVAFSLDGPGSRDLIATSCSLDLHPRAFAPGQCAQTLFAQCPVLIHHPDESDRFDLVFDVGHGAYIRRWLADAAAR